MADAAEGPPTKRQRLTAELESSAAGRQVLETVSCSICTEVFEDPVSPRGSVHTYCRACIRQALAVQPRCPLSNAQITIPRRGGVDAVLDGNHQVRSMIASQPVTCKYASHGCTARPALESIDAHEATCPHKPVACSHERCRFVGSRAETAAHEKVCPFVLLGPVLDAQAAEIRSLQGEVRDAKRRLTAEHEASERLKARLEALEAARPAVVSPARRRASEDDVREARALFDEGLRHRENKRWPEAIAAFQKCVALDANHCKAWFELGMAYYNRNGRKNCEAEYEPYTRCIALDPKHVVAHANLGLMLKNVFVDFGAVWAASPVVGCLFGALGSGRGCRAGCRAAAVASSTARGPIRPTFDGEGARSARRRGAGQQTCLRCPARGAGAPLAPLDDRPDPRRGGGSDSSLGDGSEPSRLGGLNPRRGPRTPNYFYEP